MIGSGAPLARRELLFTDWDLVVEVSGGCTADPARPSDIPSTPERIYGAEFQGWGDWLGTGTISPSNRNYRSFTEARAFVHMLHLKNREGWQAYCRSGEKPVDIPSSPGRIYKNEFKGWGDWLDTGNVAPRNGVYLPFAEARAFVHQLGLKNQKE